ncbi:MAG: hypothetical protein HQK58_14165 [Deltaproteobacteria bacterium]|nr:hypothetical protein [Deltaproteobacteria bacterium]
MSKITRWKKFEEMAAEEIRAAGRSYAEAAAFIGLLSECHLWPNSIGGIVGFWEQGQFVSFGSEDKLAVVYLPVDGTFRVELLG